MKTFYFQENIVIKSSIILLRRALFGVFIIIICVILYIRNYKCIGTIKKLLRPTSLQIILEYVFPKKNKPNLVPKFNLYISEVIHDILSGTTRSQKEL